MRTLLEKILMLFLILIAIGATIQGLKTIETLNRYEMALSTLAKQQCGDKEPVIDWPNLTLYCMKEGQIQETINLITKPID